MATQNNIYNNNQYDNLDILKNKSGKINFGLNVTYKTKVKNFDVDDSFLIEPLYIKNNILTDNQDTIYIVNEEGKKHILDIDTIELYVNSIIETSNSGVDESSAKRLINYIFPKLKKYNTVKDVDDAIINFSSDLIVYNNKYSNLSVWMLINELHSATHDDYYLVAKQMRKYDNKKKKRSIMNDGFYNFVKNNREKINSQFRYERDYSLSYFGYRTLEKSYLKKFSDGKIIERPQHLYMRVAIAIHYRSGNIDNIWKTYDYLSQHLFTHATPTLFNAGTLFEQLSSCFLLGIGDDLGEIGDSWKDSALISKFAGGIGYNISNLRCEGSFIESTGSPANGLRVINVFNGIARYANQGGKRPGSFAFFVEPWHGDIFYFLDLKKNIGAETERSRDVFLGLMINDLFMERVKNDEMWSLMCPKECKKIVNTYGNNFREEYEKYEKKGKYIKKIPAKELALKIMEAQFETGVPYIMFKDSINDKSNQKNIGVINGSNLCCEILEVSDKDNYSVCNLASIGLPKYVEFDSDGNASFNYSKLYDVVRTVTRNLNNMIDINYFPIEKAEKTNNRDRPIGIGPQGLADVFNLFKTPFGSPLSRELNKNIHETIYFAAVTESMIIAKEKGKPYDTYYGSPISKGLFQFNLWGLNDNDLSGIWDWEELRNEIKKYGIYNSLVTACMPTASTSQIMNNNECFEPYTENIYTRSTNAGEFYVVNHHLEKELRDINMWNDDVIDMIKYYEGSIANIKGIPDSIKETYKTVWEISPKVLIDMAADRGPFIDQTQSMNLFVEKPNFSKLWSCFHYGWKKGLKTGMYYLRSKPGSNPNKFGIDINKINEIKSGNILPCKYIPSNLRKDGDCLMCQG